MSLSSSIPHPSLSRNLQSAAPLPTLLHSLQELQSSVLSISADDYHIFSGSQSEDISVWSKSTFALTHTLCGHTGSVLALEIAKEKEWLFSSSGDSTVRVWSTKTLSPIYVLNPYYETGAGDLFSLAWCSTLQTIYIGCQNTSLQWFDFSQHNLLEISDAPGSGASTPRKAHKFFDSYPQYQRRPADIFANNGRDSPPVQQGSGSGSESSGSAKRGTVPKPQAILEIPGTNVIDSAHYGYIYCMALLPPTREGANEPGPRADEKIHLVTGSGDETIKVWQCSPEGPALLETLSCCQGAILSLVARGETIYSGCQDGYVKVWDLETKTLVRTIIVQEGIDVISLSMLHSDLYTCSANGQIQRWSASFDCTASWPGHENAIALSSLITRGKGKDEFSLLTGGNDNHINIWEVNPPKTREDALLFQESSDIKNELSTDPLRSSSDPMAYALAKFISIPSVSSNPSNWEDCRQTAIWLKKCLNQLGAQSTLLATGEGTNPLVLATFSGTKTNQPNPRVLFYGHYDVISAPLQDWSSDPFRLSGRNGYLYGRGATDNKGPIMAVAFAAAELLGRRALGVDLVLLIEGEEECGSRGFGAAVRRHKNLIGHIDAILVSNSTWIAEDPPCITYGLRGVIHCSVEISSAHPDLHSGIEGGGVVEPMLDMVKLLATLTDGQRKVQIPGFHDSVRPQSEEEKLLFKRLSVLTQKSASSLSSRWSEPSLTVHNIETSGPKSATVIPGSVKSQVSLRIVPDQDLDTIANSLCDYLKTSFHSFKSPNTLQVQIEHTADWWLGHFDDPWFKALESAIQKEWGVEPLRIREGGSIPSVPYLEKEFGCRALHLPLGQSSDQAHLPNERISLSNLHRGKSVIERFLLTIADKDIFSVSK